MLSLGNFFGKKQSHKCPKAYFQACNEKNRILRCQRENWPAPSYASSGGQPHLCGSL